MKNISNGLKAHYAQGTTTLATCWKATLTNGTVVAATSVDRDIVFGSVTYKAAQSYMPSNIDSSAELNPDNLEIEGFLQSPAITDEDIHSGLWDYAAIEIFEVNYADLTQGRNVLRVGTLGEVRGGRSKFTAELRGLLQAYTRTIVRLVQKDCPWDLGDSRCKVDLAAITVTGAVGSVVGNRTINDAARTEEAEWFTGGKFTFTSGANAGLSMEVKRSAPGVLELTHAFYEPIAPGDTYSVYAGCLKRFEEDCKTKHNNVLHFGGFPHLPGNRIYRQGGIDYGDNSSVVLPPSGGGNGGAGGDGGAGGTGGAGGATNDNTGIKSVTSIQIAFGDVWYKDSLGNHSIDPSTGLPDYVTVRNIYTVPNHGYNVGDMVVIHNIPPPGNTPPFKHWVAYGIDRTMFIGYNDSPSTLTDPEGVFFSKVRRVTADTFELWGVDPISYLPEYNGNDFASLMAMPVDFEAPYEGGGTVEKDIVHNNITGYTSSFHMSAEGSWLRAYTTTVIPGP